MVRHSPASQKLVLSHPYLQIDVVRAVVLLGYTPTTKCIKKGKTTPKICKRQTQESLRSTFHVKFF